LEEPESKMQRSEATCPRGPAEPYDPHDDLLEWLRTNFETYGPVFWASLFGANVLVVGDPHVCEYILRKNWRNYNRDGQIVKRMSMLLGRGLVGSNGSFWASQRRMIQPLFSKSSVGSLFQVINESNRRLLQRWRRAAQHGKTVNVTRDVSAMVLEITLVTVFGQDYSEIAKHFNILVDPAARDLAFVQKFNSLRQLILQIAERRRSSGVAHSDFLGGLLLARDREHGRPMPDPQLASEVVTLIVGGHETTASLLNWMWYLLASHSEVQERLSEEFERIPWTELEGVEILQKYTYAQQVIEEALRLYPSVWLMNRKAIKDDWIGGHFVPAGTEIYISPHIIQRSPHLWEKPDQFDPDRMNSAEHARRHEFTQCPFGAGPRNCIGEPLARAEIQIHLMTVARELWLRLHDQTPAEIEARVHLLSKHEFIMQPRMKSPQDQAPMAMTAGVPGNASA
jgi:enediyne biosynthesis protein E7